MITIIVLLILSGVTIAILTGENGILTQAGKAKIETRGASVEEAKNLWKQNQKTDEYTGTKTEQTLEELLSDLQSQELLTNEEIQVIKETGKVTIGSRTIVFEKFVVDYLEVGNYVKYPDKNGNNILCKVLYNNADYGVQLVALNPVDIVTLGYNDSTLPLEIASQSNFEKAKYSYNNAIITLNNKAETYRNPKYTDEGGARCIGSVPDNLNSEASDYFTSSYSYMSKYNDTLKNKDKNYEEDWNQLNVIDSRKITDTSKSSLYWLASRSIGSSDLVSDFYIRRGDSSGNLYYWSGLFNIYSNGRTYGYSQSMGFRPVFSLNSTAKVKDGDGLTEDTAFNLE